MSINEMSVDKKCIDLTPVCEKVREIIAENICKEHGVKDWNEYKNNILNNLNKIDFNTEIENYIVYGKKLYVTKKQLKDLLYKMLPSNRNIFECTTTYGVYGFREEIEVKQRNLGEFLDDCVKILVKKQLSKKK